MIVQGAIVVTLTSASGLPSEWASQFKVLRQSFFMLWASYSVRGQVLLRFSSLGDYLKIKHANI